ncbi:MAG: outer membrane protein transport protein [Deltaproteobacteria bacterium]|nr:outer membrane protein transport protein [Deltaproteobacteria bacterium]
MTLAETPQNWSNTYRYSLGVNYHLNDKTTLRGGLAFDETPTSDAYRTARIPDEDRTCDFGRDTGCPRRWCSFRLCAHLR